MTHQLNRQCQLVFKIYQDDDDQLSKEDYDPLSKAVIDDFTDEALRGCLALLDTLPDTVYRVCDLLVSML
jgi:E3 ubiquitin-protein ligase HUWE1